MEIREFSGEGRTLLIEYRCRRCNKTHTETFKSACEKNKEHYGYLHNMKAPQGWKTINNTFLLCDECSTEFNNFINKKGALSNG